MGSPPLQKNLRKRHNPLKLTLCPFASLGTYEPVHKLILDLFGVHVAMFRKDVFHKY